MVATCQFPVGADVRENLGYVRRQIRTSSELGAHVAHFPEASLSGYAGTDFASHGGFDWALLRECTRAVLDLAREYPRPLQPGGQLQRLLDPRRQVRGPDLPRLPLPRALPRVQAQGRPARLPLADMDQPEPPYRTIPSSPSGGNSAVSLAHTSRSTASTFTNRSSTLSLKTVRACSRAWPSPEAGPMYSFRYFSRPFDDSMTTLYTPGLSIFPSPLVLPSIRILTERAAGSTGYRPA